MKVLILENELYLAQSMHNKLSDVGFECEIIGSVSAFDKTKKYQVALISTNVADYAALVEELKSCVVIMLVSYISVDTVVAPLQNGASDYIQKPFMMEELIRKIKHHQEFKRLESLNKTYNDYVEALISKNNIGHFDYKKIKLPLILKSYKHLLADTFVFNYIKACQSSFTYINLSQTSNLSKTLKHLDTKQLVYISDIHELKYDELLSLLKEFEKRQFIFHTSSNLEQDFIRTIDLDNGEKSFNNNEILTIDEYVKYIISNYQEIFPDTDLSRKLGISRKSLWEKRKKYGLSKKK